MKNRIQSWRSYLTLGVLLLLSFGIEGGIALAGDDAEEFFIQHQQRRYFDLPMSARTLGMGGSILPTARDASSVFGNPAGLGWLDKMELSLSYSRDRISGEEFPIPAGTPNFRDIDEDFNEGFFQKRVAYLHRRPIIH